MFVRTDAAPQNFVDVQVPGVEWAFTDLQRAIVRELRETTGTLTTREIADAVDCSKEHVRQTLDRLRDPELGIEAVQVLPEAGAEGATLYADNGLPNEGLVDVDESPTGPYETTNRWSLAICDLQAGAAEESTAEEHSAGGVWDWRRATDGGGPPD